MFEVTLATYLIGTNRSFSDACKELDIDESSISEQELTKMIFKCDGCGFWEKVNKRAVVGGDSFCEDCTYLEVHQD